MSKNEIDAVDLVGIALVGIFGPMALGVVSFSITVFGGFSFTDLIWSASGIEVTWAAVLCLVGVLWIVVNNFVLGDWDLTNMEPWLSIPVALSLSIVPVYVVVPAVQDAFTQFPVVALAFAMVQAGFGPLLSWEG